MFAGGSVTLKRTALGAGERFTRSLCSGAPKCSMNRAHPHSPWGRRADAGFTDQDMEPQSGEVTCSRSQSEPAAKVGTKARSPDSQACA